MLNGQIRSEDYKCTLHLPWKSCSSHSRTPPPFEPPNRQDLFTQPSKVIDLWRIEGGSLDLLLQQERYSFPPHSLKGPFALVFSLETLVLDLVLTRLSLIVLT